MLRAWPPEAIPAHFMLSERPGCPCPDLLPCLRASSQPGTDLDQMFCNIQEPSVTSLDRPVWPDSNTDQDLARPGGFSLHPENQRWCLRGPPNQSRFRTWHRWIAGMQRTGSRLRTWKLWGQKEEMDTFNPSFTVIWHRIGFFTLQMFRLI